jgi:hypothetical protein
MSDALSSGFQHAAHPDREWYIPNGIQPYLEREYSVDIAAA